MTFGKSTSLAAVTLAICIAAGCSSKDDRDKYDNWYGSGSKSREETAMVKIANDRKNQPEKPAAAPAGTAAPAAAGDSAKSGDSASTGAPAAPAPKARKPVPAEVSALLNKHACFACHQAYDKVIGPAYSEVAKKNYSADEIVELVHNPKPEHWPGYPPMAPLAHVPKGDIVIIANWINSL